MVLASQLSVGAVVRFEGQDYKVIGTEYRPGQGKMSGAMHARLRMCKEIFPKWHIVAVKWPSSISLLGRRLEATQSKKFRI